MVQKNDFFQCRQIARNIVNYLGEALFGKNNSCVTVGQDVSQFSLFEIFVNGHGNRVALQDAKVGHNPNR